MAVHHICSEHVVFFEIISKRYHLWVSVLHCMHCLLYLLHLLRGWCLGVIALYYCPYCI